MKHSSCTPCRILVRKQCPWYQGLPLPKPTEGCPQRLPTRVACKAPRELPAPPPKKDRPLHRLGTDQCPPPGPRNSPRTGLEPQRRHPELGNTVLQVVQYNPPGCLKISNVNPRDFLPTQSYRYTHNSKTDCIYKFFLKPTNKKHYWKKKTKRKEKPVS